MATAKTIIKLSFNPVSVTKKLINQLEDRAKTILTERFGLVSGTPRTLESIGKEYGITRERVRQIEACVLGKIRQNLEEYPEIEVVFNELGEHMKKEGGLVHEHDFMSSRTKEDAHKCHLHFLLVVGKPFEKIKENEHFHPSWTVDKERAEIIREALVKLHKDIKTETIFSESEILAILDRHLQDALQEKLTEDVLRSILNISRVVGFNALGEWGVASSPYIKPRGMRDYAFLVMRKHGSPMHFSETASAIKENFDKPAHMQTVHNELIKDDRFVLVGRGLYALKEWGYESGVVRKVIERILREGALPKEEIVKRVLKERHIKENTILVNLQNKKYFTKDDQGNYMLL